jgi:putative transposase
LLGSLEKRLKEIFYEIVGEHEFEILAIELTPDHVHVFVLVTPKLVPGKMVSIFKNITAGVNI